MSNLYLTTTLQKVDFRRNPFENPKCEINLDGLDGALCESCQTRDFAQPTELKPKRQRTTPTSNSTSPKSISQPEHDASLDKTEAETVMVVVEVPKLNKKSAQPQKRVIADKDDEDEPTTGMLRSLNG